MSRPKLVLYHNGGMSGYLTAFYLFPETNSVIVALGNSHGLGDGPDWSAQAIAQTMFDLQPPIDFAEVSKGELRQSMIDMPVWQQTLSIFGMRREANRSGLM